MSPLDDAYAYSGKVERRVATWKIVALAMATVAGIEFVVIVYLVAR